MPGTMVIVEVLPPFCHGAPRCIKSNCGGRYGEGCCSWRNDSKPVIILCACVRIIWTWVLCSPFMLYHGFKQTDRGHVLWYLWLSCYAVSYYSSRIRKCRAHRMVRSCVQSVPGPVGGRRFQASHWSQPAGSGRGFVLIYLVLADSESDGVIFSLHFLFFLLQLP